MTAVGSMGDMDMVTIMGMEIHMGAMADIMTLTLIMGMVEIMVATMGAIMEADVAATIMDTMAIIHTTMFRLADTNICIIRNIKITAGITVDTGMAMEMAVVS